MARKKNKSLNQVNEGLNLLDRKHLKLNTCRFNTNNTLKHELLKAEICYKLQKIGLDYVTEAKFLDGSGVADIFVPQISFVYECLHTESEERFNKKKYPVDRIVKYRVGEKVVV